MDSSIDSSAPNSTAYIGNLRSDRSVEQLQREMQSLFESVGVVVLLEDIKVHRKSAKKPAYGFVNLKDKETFDICAEKLGGLASVDAKELIYPGKVLEVNIARRNKPIKVDNNVPQAKHKKGKKHSKKQKHKTTSISNMIQNVSMATDGITIATYPVTIATSVSNNSVQLTGSDENHRYIYFQRPDLGERYYYIGQKLGTEDRLTEYKQGGGNYLDTRFKIHVEQYVCAFLNSEGGTLLVGVKDDCTVCGVEVSSQREDQLRLDIDKIMKGFNPHVFTNSYKVNFVPVYPSPFITQGNQVDQMVGTQNSSTGGYQGLSLSPSFSSKELNPSSLIASKTGTESQHADCNLSLTLNEKSHLQTQKLKDTSQSLEDQNFTTKHESLMKIDLKVIEVEVHPPYCPTSEPPSLYENNRGEVYVRRDGSIQGPLKASQILEWSKQNVGQSYHLERSLLLQENQRKQNEIEQLVKQQKYIEDQHQEKMEKVKEKEDNLATEIELLRNQELKTRGELEDIKRTTKLTKR